MFFAEGQANAPNPPMLGMIVASHLGDDMWDGVYKWVYLRENSPEDVENGYEKMARCWGWLTY